MAAQLKRCLSTACHNQSPPEFSSSVQTRFRVPLGAKQFRLICPVKTTDSDLVMIQWKKDDEQISFDFNNRYKLSRSDRELKIRNPQTSDSGTYQCQAVNGFGHRELDFDVYIYDPANEKEHAVDETITLSERSSPPKWLNESEMRSSMLAPLRLSVGRKLQLKCPASGNPLPHVTWLRNNKPIERDEVTFDHSSSLLTLSNLQTSDSGEYVCRVENEHGSVEATFRVRVGDFFNADEESRWSAGEHAIEQSPLIDEPFNSTVRVGHTAQFQCKVRSQHQPLIKWLKRVEDPSAIRRVDANATLIHANNMHLLLLEQPQSSSQLSDGLYTNRLVIPNANFEHAGTYICVVTNADGDIVYRSAHLNILSSYERNRTIPSIYYYGGVPVIVLFVCVIGYAIYFLHRNQQSSKGRGESSGTTAGSSVKPVSNTVRSPRPPPPNMPPPQAPLSTYAALPQQQHSQATFTSSARYPLLVAQELTGSHSPAQSSNNVHHHFVATAERLPKSQHQRRPTLIHRTYADDDSSNFYEASTPQPTWTQTFAGAMCADARDLNNDFRKCRLQPYPGIYSCSEFDHLNEQQLPFIAPNIQRR
ncbi:Fibroblast growth factor receptor-like 1 [Toxocara canis]|uniref:receptor protein-tyrosine kinase n=1 Tax=Toxocara canis TaxID=6265 RepID=A0A0B2VNI2_TOXCA|nr:Fibroblast growth factor receptor-like 1 [Toxocara canis]